MRWILVTILMLFLLFCTARSSERAPVFKFTDFSGTKHQLSDYKDKPIVVNWWAVWCPYCVAELPDISKVRQECPDVVVIGIAFDDEGNPPGFVKQRKYDWIFGYSEESKNKYNIDAIPVTVFILPDGTLYNRIDGQASKKELEDNFKYLENSIKK